MFEWAAQFAALASFVCSLKAFVISITYRSTLGFVSANVPQSAVYLASPNLWVYANCEPGWGPVCARILTTMFCFRWVLVEEERSVFQGWGVGGRCVGRGYSSSVCVCVCEERGGTVYGGVDGVNACQPDRASSVWYGQLGVSTWL